MVSLSVTLTQAAHRMPSGEIIARRQFKRKKYPQVETKLDGSEVFVNDKRSNLQITSSAEFIVRLHTGLYDQSCG